MKILAITGNRADYDLMSPLFALLQADPELDLQLLVSGGHLVKEYGYSIDSIKADGYSILCEIESILYSDSKQARLKSASILLQSSIDLVAYYDPDLILYVGDREDVIVGALLGCYLEKPTMHFISGDHATDGNTDNAIRHAAAKLSSIQMVILPQHAERLRRIGEANKRIFYIGNMALDNFVSHIPFTKSQIKAALNIQEGFDAFALAIFHPLPAERDQYAYIYNNLLETLIAKKISVFINAPNTDPGNYAGLKVLQQFSQHPQVYYTRHLPRELFLSIYKQARFIIGNSSSGIVESASIPIPAINVGLRQQGRFTGKNVIFCGTDQAAIAQAIDTACSLPFLNMIKDMHNPYGDGHSAKRAYDLIKQLPLKTFLYKNEDPLFLE